MIYHPPATNREGRGETAGTRTTVSAPEQQRRQAAQAEPWFASLLSEDRTKVREVVKALERIAGVGGEMRRNPHGEERASDIAAWVRYGQPIAEKLSAVPGLPLDAEIKGALTEAFKSLQSIRRRMSMGRFPEGTRFNRRILRERR